MVESKLRVEVTHFSNVNNPFYGNTITKQVIEKTLIHDKDMRKGIAPCGVVATFSIDRSYDNADGKHIDAKEVFDIKVNRHYLDEDVLPNTYHTFFHLDEKVYELFAHIEGKKILHVGLAEWLQEGYFEDGDELDNVYDEKDGLVNFDILEQ